MRHFVRECEHWHCKYIRHDSDASRVECVVAAACRRVGGVEAFAGSLSTALQSPNLELSFRAAKLFLNLLIARNAIQATPALPGTAGKDSPCVSVQLLAGCELLPAMARRMESVFVSKFCRFNRLRVRVSTIADVDAES